MDDNDEFRNAIDDKLTWSLLIALALITGAASWVLLYGRDAIQ